MSGPSAEPGELEAALEALKGMPRAFVPGAISDVRANDITGDGTNESQYFSSVAASGRFSVISWIDTKALDGPVAQPQFTEAGYGWSCDWGATYTDGISFPRLLPNEQVEFPAVASDGAGRFYAVGQVLRGIGATGAATGVALGFWVGTLDTLNCTFNWELPVMLDENPASSSVGPRSARIAADPDGQHLYIAYTARRTDGFIEIRVLASADRGATWAAPRVVSIGTTGTVFASAPDIAIGPDHEIHVVWGDELLRIGCAMDSDPPNRPVLYSALGTDYGATWTASPIATEYTHALSDGPMNMSGYPKSIVRVAVDRSTSSRRGTAYACWTATGRWGVPASTGVTVAEVEPNGLPSQALELPIGGDGTGIAANTSDLEFWRVHMQAGSTYLIRAEAPGSCPFTYSQRFFLRLFAPPLNLAVAPVDTVLAGSTVSANMPSEIIFTCKQTGDYYARVLLGTTGGTNIGYTVRAREISYLSPGAEQGRDAGDVLVARRPPFGSWQPPVNATASVEAGYHESGGSLSVDDRGDVHLLYFQHAPDASVPAVSLRGQPTDVFESVSSDGSSFQSGTRISDTSGLFGRNFRSVWTDRMWTTSQTADGGHIYRTWDDQRLPTRLTTSIDIYTEMADLEGPFVAFVSAPPESAAVTGSVTVQMTGRDRRNPLDPVLYSYRLRPAAGPVVFSSVPVASSTVQIDWPEALADGWYDVEVVGQDVAGNFSGSPATLRLLLDRNAPTLTIVAGPAQGEQLTGGPVSFSWEGHDSFSAIVAYSHRVDGGAWVSDGLNRTVQLSGLAEGMHMFEVRARDALGNEGSVTCPYETAGILNWWTGHGTTKDQWGTSTFDPNLPGSAHFAPGRDGQLAFDFRAPLAPWVMMMSGIPAFGRSSFTIDVWARYDGATASFRQQILSTPDSYLFPECELYLQDGNLTWEVGDNILNPANPFQSYMTVAAPATSITSAPGTWHHIALVRDQSVGLLRMFLDGVLVATNTAGPFGDDEVNLDGTELAGAGPSTGIVYRWNGMLADFVVTKRALSADEISAIHAANGRQACAPTAAAIARTFALDLTPPETGFSSGPADNAVVATADVDFTASGSDAVTPSDSLKYSFSVDGGAFSVATRDSVLALRGLADGVHTVAVFATDLAGRPDPTPATRGFTVHTQPGVDVPPVRTPRVTRLRGNSPNPWDSQTGIAFDLARDEIVTIAILDVRGRVVSQPLTARALPAGSHVIPVERLGSGPGVYFYRFRAGAHTETRRMVLR